MRRPVLDFSLKVIHENAQKIPKKCLSKSRALNAQGHISPNSLNSHKPGPAFNEIATII